MLPFRGIAGNSLEMGKVTLSVSISEEARRILVRESEALVNYSGDRLPIGDLVTELVLWFEEMEGRWGELREEIHGNLSEKVQERRRKDRERKRLKRTSA